jgi:hypothetical protein
MTIYTIDVLMASTELQVRATKIKPVCEIAE